jgi:hypothetical protein
MSSIFFPDFPRSESKVYLGVMVKLARRSREREIRSQLPPIRSDICARF